MPPQLDPSKIVRCAIFPAIGIARVGNSLLDCTLEPDATDAPGCFIGPEVIAAKPPLNPSFYRDAHGALKRQVARFRVYAYDKDGGVLGEVNASNGFTITWSVHLANLKAACYAFEIARDIPEGKTAPPSALRNPAVHPRSDLKIDGGLRSVHGPRASSAPLLGKFMGTEVYLGELKTDEHGRLLVLGGRGAAGSHNNTRVYTYANNDTWYDDTSDGPVTAEVSFNGVKVETKPAWVVVAPPNYAPQQKSLSTMWDVLRDVARHNKKPDPNAPKPNPSFNEEIRPIFERLTKHGWVNRAYAIAYGVNGLTDLSSPEMLERLSTKDSNPPPGKPAASALLRRMIYNLFRDPDPDRFPHAADAPLLLPWSRGDATGIKSSPREYHSLTRTQLKFLKAWADGDFIPDYDPTAKPPRETIDDYSPAERPVMLTRAALDYCIADSFHPGYELSWVMRNRALYMKNDPDDKTQIPKDDPCRIEHAKDPEPEFGMLYDGGGFFSDRNVQGESLFGPLSAQRPGGLTRWLAVPWQADAGRCGAGIKAIFSEFVPTFWPTRVPNDVISEKQYLRIIRGGKGGDDPDFQPDNRKRWKGTGALNSGPSAVQAESMIKDWASLGIVQERQSHGLPKLPPTIQVADRDTP